MRPVFFYVICKKRFSFVKCVYIRGHQPQGLCLAIKEQDMINDNLTEAERVQRRIEFYAKVSAELASRLKGQTLCEDMPSSHYNDYDGGRFDFETSRGVK